MTTVCVWWFGFSFKSTSQSYFATQWIVLSCWQRKLQSLVIHVFIFMPRCCRIIVIEYFMTSVMVLVEILFVQVCTWCLTNLSSIEGFVIWFTSHKSLQLSFKLYEWRLQAVIGEGVVNCCYVAFVSIIFVFWLLQHCESSNGNFKNRHRCKLQMLILKKNTKMWSFKCLDLCS